ncbi:hypothetical protein CHISP_1843 [Chitinispirillum alkaliphilum]|nr:hypothetical protein CHISP_1843 [Chitinispirillum alkaliphilum]
MRLNEIRIIKKEYLDFLRKIIRVKGALYTGINGAQQLKNHRNFIPLLILRA